MCKFRRHCRRDAALVQVAVRAGGRVTAGNSAGLTDGAKVCLLCSEAAAAEHSLEPRMRLVSYAFAGVQYGKIAIVAGMW